MRVVVGHEFTLRIGGALLLRSKRHVRQNGWHSTLIDAACIRYISLKAPPLPVTPDPAAETHGAFFACFEIPRNTSPGHGNQGTAPTNLLCPSENRKRSKLRGTRERKRRETGKKVGGRKTYAEIDGGQEMVAFAKRLTEGVLASVATVTYTITWAAIRSRNEVLPNSLFGLIVSAG